MDLALALIALGPKHNWYQLHGSFWWSLRGIATAFSLLKADLQPTNGFKSLTASQRKSDAFYLAEALTRWFAHKHLKAKLVVPLEAWTGTWIPKSKSAPYPKTMPKYFRHSVKPGMKSEPDFLAFTKAGDAHVLESKGRAGFGFMGLPVGSINAARNKALRQVCQVSTVNGKSPVTRTACVFGFDRSGLFGQVTDPPSIRGYDFRAEPSALIKLAYACIFDPVFEEYHRPITAEHTGIEFAPGWKFGIHKAIFEQLRLIRTEADFAALLEQLDKLDTTDSRTGDEAISFSPDGLILMGDPESVWKKRMDSF